MLRMVMAGSRNRYLHLGYVSDIHPSLFVLFTALEFLDAQFEFISSY